MDANPPRRIPPGQPQKKPLTFGDVVFIGLFMCLPVGMFTVPIGIAEENWWLIILTPPATIALVGLITLISRMIGGNRTILRSLGAVALVLGTAAGAFLIWFGVSAFLNADVCDPGTSRCVLVVNGVASGESTQSVGSQLFGAFLLSLGAIVPGVLLMGVCVRTAVRARRRKDPTEE
ncbi:MULTISPECIES: hypothetical protein [unclassified Nocardiopsis]|uniref:hypothetical protein n=1 Tax=unclassified Nocardiopsis TaxID=2649073 RepID=UPI00135A7E6C|nr:MULTISPECIES: hypothetical protein [unclassified Nocardiopsis]